ncbi:MAG: hypothetical protein SGARI_000565 [Bacillariaceae sp.]
MCALFCIVQVYQARHALEYTNDSNFADLSASSSESRGLRYTSSTSSIQQQQRQLQQQQADCTFFLAESAIPRGGLGVFTAKAIAKGEPAQPFPDICVYVTNADPDRGTEIHTHTWQDYRFGAQWLGGDNVRGQCMGLVTTFNSMGIAEYSSARPAVDRTLIHTNGGLDRAKDPGAGAITHYFGASSEARRDLQPGDELLLNDAGWGGNTYQDDNDDDALPVAPVRSPAWLQKHGMCVDHIKPGPATDPSMGRGAFANRKLLKGTIVAPAPVQIFPNRTEFLASNDDESTQSNSSPEELIVNYCFQPPNSSLLLYPYGAGAGLINHSPDPSKINVKLQWSNHPVSHKSWLDEELSMAQFAKMQYPGSLIIDFVATRDIAEDEEIFMDYGQEWDEAWAAHVQQWKPDPDASKSYVYPKDMDTSKPFRTVTEQMTNPDPKNIRTVCESLNSYKKKSLTFTEGKNNTVSWRGPGQRFPENLIACDIVDRKESSFGNGTDYTYSVQWFKKIDKKRTMIVETDVSHSAIHFVDRPGQSDQHLLNAFRHPIGLPLDMTPSKWTNQRNSEWTKLS